MWLKEFALEMHNLYCVKLNHGGGELCHFLVLEGYCAHFISVFCDIFAVRLAYSFIQRS